MKKYAAIFLAVLIVHDAIGHFAMMIMGRDYWLERPRNQIFAWIVGVPKFSNWSIYNLFWCFHWSVCGILAVYLAVAE